MSTMTAAASLEVIAAQEVAAAIRQLRKGLQGVLPDYESTTNSGLDDVSKDHGEWLSALVLGELRLAVDRPERVGLDGLGLSCSDE